MDISRVYNNGDIPLIMNGTEVDITLKKIINNGNIHIEVNCVPISMEKPREIIIQPVTPMGSDCTQGYIVRGAEGMKVRDFIAYICEKYDNEHGDFNIMFPFKGAVNFGTQFMCHYDNGRIYANSIANENFDKVMNLTINNVKAKGGWGRMDYDIDCENNEG